MGQSGVFPLTSFHGVVSVTSDRSLLNQCSIFSKYIGHLVCWSAQYIRRIQPISRLYRSIGFDCRWYTVTYLRWIPSPSNVFFHVWARNCVPFLVTMIAGVPTSLMYSFVIHFRMAAVVAFFNTYRRVYFEKVSINGKMYQTSPLPTRESDR